MRTRLTRSDSDSGPARADREGHQEGPAGDAVIDDRRPRALAQLDRTVLANAGQRMGRQRAAAGAIQRKSAEGPAPPNRTGLPDQLKAGIESLSGISMDSVKVHYNSSQPAQLDAHAYAQGTDIHLAPGQERHLPHEAWHVVQQAQGRVQTSWKTRSGIGINDEDALESEADRMGSQALQLQAATSGLPAQIRGGPTVVRQLALPVSADDFYEAHRANIDAGRDPVSIDIFKNLEFVAQIVKPFLDNRKDLIIANEADGEQVWQKADAQLCMLAGFHAFARNNVDCRVFATLATDARIAPLIALADRLPEMYEVHALAGGYQSDNDLRGGMKAQQKTMTGMSDGGTVKSGKPGVAGLDVPVIKNATFMNSERIPAALKRLVNDIYLHWKAKAVLDTRTDQQKTDRSTTPDNAGALRSWHLNGHASLPAIDAPTLSHPLHDHYRVNSQAGNVHEGTAPIGYAEYTGIDADQNKIILNYENGAIYVTAVHYHYWFDLPGKSPEKMSGSLQDSLNRKPREASAEMLRSPWVQVLMA